MANVPRRLIAALSAAVTIGAALVYVAAADGPERPRPALSSATDQPRTSERRTGRVRNVAFYYNGTLDITNASAEEVAAHLGHASIVVSVPGDDEAATTDAIHSIGAKAYRYVQFYWAPRDKAYDGVDLRANPDWAYCRRGDSPSVGQHSSGARWRFLDLNERRVRTHVARLLARYRTLGWDGVMFDRGEAATQYAEDGRGRPIWHRRSTCTKNPYRARATFADAFVNVLPLAHDNGLESMMNTGKSPFDPIAPLRPDPRDRQCRQRDWARCSFVNDTWDHLDRVLNEAAGRPRAVDWERTFVGNARSERHQARGRGTVGLITAASLRDPDPSRRDVFYQWSRIKLFNLPVAVGTGDDQCAGATEDAICNRFGVYPRLVDATLGTPTDRGPDARQCRGRSEIRCLWVRRYAAGASVVNVTGGRLESVRIRLGTNGCRYVYDVYRRAAIKGNACVNRVVLDVGRWQGRPLRFARSPWSTAERAE